MSSTLSFVTTTVTAAEGNFGSAFAQFVVQRLGNTSDPASVDWAVQLGSASPSDFAGGVVPSGTLVFLAGETSKTIAIPIAGDSLLEGNEGFSVVLSSPVGGIFTGLFGTAPTASGTIINDDGAILSFQSAGPRAYEGTAANGSIEFTVTRSGDTSIAASATWAVSVPMGGFNAALGTDFVGGVLPSGVVSFAPGETTKVISLPILADSVFESSESFDITLTNPSAGATIGQGQSGGQIVNDDGAVSLTVSGPSNPVVEGQSGTSAVVFTVTRTGDPTGAVTADWSVVAGTGAEAAATADDFVGGVLPSGSVSFAAGEMTKIISVQIAGDTVIEPAEAFSLRLVQGSFTISSTTVVIPNDDGALFSLRPSTVSSNLLGNTPAVPEGNAGTTTGSFIILRQGDLSGTVSVNWGITPISGFFLGGTPVDAADFLGGTLPGGTVTFMPGELSRLVTFGIQGDTIFEGEEQFNVSLSAPGAGGALSPTGSSMTMAILNDDQAATLTLSPITAVTEGNAGATPVTVTITRSGNTALAASATWSVSGAVTGADFVGGSLPTGTVSFAAGETVKTITFDVAGDAAVESDESFSVTLSSLSLGANSSGAVQGTITNDDGAILSLGTPLSQAEGDSGTTPFVFTVTRSGDTSIAASANWSVQFAPIISGAASADPTDFVGGTFPSGSVQFAAGETSQTVTLLVAGDTLAEGSENFILSLLNPSTGAVLGSRSATINTILNDEPVTTATLSILLGTLTFVNEGNAGSTPVTFTVTRAGNLNQTSTANWAVTGFNTVGGTAATADDFAGGMLPTGTVTFAPGQDQQTITVNLAGDTLLEANETYLLTLSSPSAGNALGTSSATGTIVNDDGALLSISSGPFSAEGQSGSTPFNFTVTRGGNTSIAASVNWFVATSTLGTSASASDFAGGVLPGGTVSFAAGETAKTITVLVAGDAVLEANETFEVRLAEPSAGAAIASSSSIATATIANDDGAILALSVGSSQITEGNSGTTTAELTVTRSGNLGIAASASWSVSASPAGVGQTSLTGADFVGGVLPSGTVSFAVGETSKTIILQFAGDTLVESNESLSVVLSSPSTGSFVSAGSSTLTLVNDDGAIIGFAPPAFVRVVEGDSGSTPVTFTVTRSGDTSIAASANWAVASFSGAAGSDFVGGVLPSGTVSFAAGETSKTITINVAGDTTLELTESFTVQLLNPSTGAALNASTTGGAEIVTDDGTTGVISIAPSNPASLSVSEGNASSSLVFVTVQRTGDASGPAVATWAVTSATADGADFLGGVLPSGTVIFAPGVTTSSISFSVAGDTAVEPNEAFTVSLTGVSNGASLGATTSIAGVITADDGAIISATTASGSIGNEGQAGNTPFTITISRTGNTGIAVSADWAVAPSSAPGTSPASAADFAGGVFPAGTVSFAAGETSKTITVLFAGDTLFEQNESFVVNLSNPSVGAAIGASSSFRILNDDGAVVGFADATGLSVFEGAAGASTPMTFSVLRSGDTSQAISVDWAVQLFLNTNATDFVGGVVPSGTLSFAAGETQKTITLNIAGDSAIEGDEFLNVVLTNPTGQTTLGRFSSVSATIRNDDPTTLAIAATDADKAEGNGGGGTPFTFTVTRAGDVSGTSTVGWSFTNTNTPGFQPATLDDFVGGGFPSGTLTFLAGETSKTITVNVLADGGIGPDERFGIQLSGATNAIITTSTAFGTIRNDDLPITGTVDPDTLTGTADEDLIQGLAGADRLNGAGGDDTLDGGPGADSLTGGAGEDLFVLAVDGPARSTLASMDVILDYNPEDFDEITLGAVNGTLTINGETRTLIANGDTGIFLSAPPTLGLSLPAQHHNIPNYQGFWLQGVTATGTPEGRGWIVVDVNGDQALDAQDFIAEVRGAFSARDLLFPTYHNLADVQWGAGLAAPGGTSGNDSLAGTGRNESFTGTPGNDVINGGGAAFNSISYASATTPIAVTITGVGSATVVKNGGAQGTDSLTNIHSIITGSGDDSFDATALTVLPFYAGSVQPNGGNDTVIGGFLIQDDGTPFANTVVAYAGGATAAVINLNTGTASDGLGGTDTLTNIRRLSLTSNLNDIVIGSAFSDQVSSSANGNRTIDLGAGTGDRWSMGTNNRFATFAPATSRVEVELGTGTSDGEITGVARKYSLINGFWVLSGTDALRGVEQANGSIGDDLLVGSSVANSFFGGEGDDTINGGAGLDTLRNDSFTGNSHLAEFGVTVNLTTGIAIDAWGFTDTLIAMEHVYGTQQADDLTGVSLPGVRTLLRGLTGNDTLSAPVADTLITADYRGDRAAVTVNLATGLATDGWGDTDRLVNIQSVIGSRFGDSLTGGARDDVLEGGGGDDSLAGGAGADLAIFTGARADYTITRDSVTNVLTVTDNTAGRDGTDRVAADVETLRFSDGDYPAATITTPATTFLSIAAASADKMEGNAASTDFTFTVTRTGDLSGVSGAAWAVTGGVNAADFAGGVLPSGTVTFSAGAASRTITIAVAGDAVFEADEGFTVTLSAPSGAVITTRIANGVIRNDDSSLIIGTGGNDTIMPGSVSSGVTGGMPDAGNNTIQGLDGDDSLDGGGGSDLLEGGAGADRLQGRDGDDTLIGGPGNDFFTPGAGNDSMVGGDPGDVLVPFDATGPLVIDIAAGTLTGQGSDSFSGILNAHGSGFADSISGSSANQYFFGQAGNDTLRGLGGNDNLIGGSGGDLLDGGEGQDRASYNDDGFDGAGAGTRGVVVNLSAISVISGADTVLAGTAIDNWGSRDTLLSIEDVTGSAMADLLVGDGLVNALEGRAGSDTLRGGDGSDYLTGGSGNDSIDGGEGANDWADYANTSDTPTPPTRGVIVNLSGSMITVGADIVLAGTAIDNWGGRDTLLGIENVVGSALGDLLVGDGQNNNLQGRAGDDTIRGGAGNDFLTGGSGNDSIDGGEGTGDGVDYGNTSDTPTLPTRGVIANLSGSVITAGADTVLAGTAIDNWGGRDTLVGVENLVGSALGDLLVGDGQNNFLEGRAGNDTVTGGGGSDNLRGGSGNDSLDGGDGANDHADYTSDFDQAGAPTRGVIVNLSSSTVTSGADTVLAGTAIDNWGGADTLTGIENASGAALGDLLVGNAQNNNFQGRGGDDTLRGGDGSDYLTGGSGNDSIDGGEGATDWADYGNTSDTPTPPTRGVIVNLSGSMITVGADTVLAGTAIDNWGGRDTLLGIENVVGSALGDLLVGDGQNNNLQGRAGDDTIRGGGGSDYLTGGSGNDSIDGGEGANDWADYANTSDTPMPPTRGVIANLSGSVITAGADTVLAGTAIDNWGGRDTLLGIENVVGSALGDLLVGDGQNNNLQGRAGDDTLRGGEGNDFLDGGEGNDSLNGGSGSDFFAGSLGSDSLDGGEATSRNTISYAALTGSISAVFTGDAAGTVVKSAGGTDSFVNINQINGTAGGDSFDGAAVSGNAPFTVAFRGGAGNDTMTGNGNSRVVADYSDAGKAVNVNLGTGVVSQDGFDGQDTLINVARVTASNGFDDTLTGGAANETFFIASAGGNKTINGGAGSDIYRYGVNAAIVIDLVLGTAVKAGGGTDILSLIESASGSGGNDSISGNAQNNTLAGDVGDDTLDGRGGFDTADYTYFSNQGQSVGITGSLTTGRVTDSWGGTDTLISIEGLTGTHLADDLTGKVVTDTSTSGGSSDTQLRGLTGNDTLRAPGTDTRVFADYRNDPGAIRINLSAADTVLGGQAVAARTGKDGFGGTDSFDKIQAVLGSNFNDTILGSERADRLYGLAGNDMLIGGAGDDTLGGGAGVDSYVGGAGFDQVTFLPYSTTSGEQPTQGVVANLVTLVIANDGYGNAESFAGGANDIEQLVGTNFADDLTGAKVNWTGEFDEVQITYLRGGNGADSIRGVLADAFHIATDHATDADANDDGFGVTVNLVTQTAVDGWGNADTLFNIGSARGSAFRDSLVGNDGDNWFRGEAGSDTIQGGLGRDVVSYRTSTAGVVLDLASGVAQDGLGGTDSLSGIENVVGSATAGDTLRGNADANSLNGYGGDDVLEGRGGNDTLIGDVGNDTAVFSGARSRYAVTRNGTTGELTVVDSQAGGDGTDLLRGIEVLRFTDADYQASSFTAPTLSIAALSADKVEGNAGNTEFTFTVTRTGDLPGVSSAAWAVTGAANAVDFVGGVLPSGVVTFSAGAASQTIAIAVVGDTVFEVDEGFTVTLSAPSGATLGTATASGVIRNDDPIAITGTSGNDTITPSLASAGVTGGLPGTGNDTILGLDGADSLDGGSGNDSLDGGTGSDSLLGGLGNDVLVGGSGNDVLTGGSGNDTQTGGLGVDRFVVDAGTDTITDLGLDGADVLIVSSGASAFATLAAAWTATAESANNGTASLTAAGFGVNLALATGANGWIVSNAASTRGVTLTGSAGNDSLTGGGGADILTGGLGDDRLTGGLGVDRFIVEAGTDRVTDLGLGGVDRLNVSAGATASATLAADWVANSFTSNNGTARLASAGFDVDLTGAVGASGWSVSNSGETAAVQLTGSVRADTLTGGNGDDSLLGGLGNDSLNGGAGDDVLTGGSGNDTQTGGAGVDRFVADAGTDTITDLGLGGADALAVSAGAAAFATLGAAWTATAETVNNGTANLTAAGFGVNLALATGASAWFVSNAASARGVTLTGSAGNDSLTGGGGADILTGGLGDDRLTGGLGVDRFIVDLGTDRITDLGLGGVDRLNVSAGATASATLAADWVANSFTSNNGTARLAASGFDVDLTGAVGASGWSVSNSGETAAVRLTGSVRSDLLTGGNGNDSLFGGLDHDTLSGGAGDDEFTGGQGFDRLIGGLGADRFVVDVGRDTITDLGVGGADVLVILAGAQAVAELGASWAATAASVNDGLANLTAAGFSVDLSLAGGASGWVVSNAGYAAGVSLTGSAGNDSLTGGNGNDTISGGLGADVLRGRNGADSFVFGSAAAADGDVITDFVASRGDMLDLRGIDAGPGAGDQAFSFIGGAAFTAGVPGQLRFAGGVLQGDVNGDGVADFQIGLTGVTSLSAASIWL
jgi:Ca2+-binding RTX toxin-like protein